MRALLLGVVVVTTLVAAEAASAGCWATVGLAPPPPEPLPGRHGRLRSRSAARAKPAAGGRKGAPAGDDRERRHGGAEDVHGRADRREPRRLRGERSLPLGGQLAVRGVRRVHAVPARRRTRSRPSRSGAGRPQAESFPLWAAVGGGILLLGALGAAAVVASRR